MVAEAKVRSVAPEQTLDIVRGTDIHPEPITWIWPGWLARGKLHILAGAPGIAKTTVALAFAASLTSGGRWPDGGTVDPADALIISYEDDPADTIVPRLMAMGADLSRIHILRGVRDGRRQRAFNVQLDLDPLIAAARRMKNLRLVIVDPIVSAIGPVDSHRNLETRQALQPLADFAAASGSVVFGITHLAKGTVGRDPLERLLGSIAFGALARIVLGAAKVQSDDGTDSRVLARIKSNIGPDDGGFYYDLRLVEACGIETVSVLWGLPIDGSARDLLGNDDEGDPPGEHGAMAEAADFLCGLLSSGSVGAKDVYRHAADAGVARRTLQRAKRKLGIKAVKTQFDGHWEWRLPGDADPKDAKGSKHESKAPLAPLVSMCPHCDGEGCQWCSS